MATITTTPEESADTARLRRQDAYLATLAVLVVLTVALALAVFAPRMSNTLPAQAPTPAGVHESEPD